jgi:acyl-CoA reductase-like NAD-dependent aldehyde dehydrogenase
MTYPHTSTDADAHRATAADPSLSEVFAKLHDARQAQRRWQHVPLSDRLAIVRRVRRRIAKSAMELAATITYPSRNGPQESLPAEVAPLLDACRFLERSAVSLLKPQRLSRWGRPIWLHAVHSEVHREPFGVVLILGAANYPLLLPGVQALQALVAGNAVLVKPAVGSTAPIEMLRQILQQSGLDPALCVILPEHPESAQEAMKQGVDKVLLTGAAATGRAVLQQLAPKLTPATMELSGCDAVFVLPSADLQVVANALRFGLRFNQSATCIAPRRVFVPRGLCGPLRAMMEQDATGAGESSQQLTPARVEQLAALPAWQTAADAVAQAVEQGAICVQGGVRHNTTTSRNELTGPTILTNVPADAPLLSHDLFAPVVSLIEVGSVEEAIRRNESCPYALGTSIFGEESAARQLAARIPAGCITINDLIAPTADPRVPFGGCRDSGFGVTRGREGLLELTKIKVIQTRRSRWLPHFDPPAPQDAELLACFLELNHSAGWRPRWAAIKRMIALIRERRTKRA